MKIGHLGLAILISASLSGCLRDKTAVDTAKKIRQLVDTIGFARYSWQMDSLLSRMDGGDLKQGRGDPWRLAICPHDDYTYVGSVYPALLRNIIAPNLILIGVAHRAAHLGIENNLVFETNTHWKGPWNDIEISPAREEIYDLLGEKFAMVSDTLHNMEHSIESLIPFLQYFNRDIKIIPILVPAMNPQRMEECGKQLASALQEIAKKYYWEWGRDFAIIVTTDAVHYGDEDWGGADRAYFGCDDLGNRLAIEHEYEIIDKCLTGKVKPDNIRLFSSYTLESDNYKEYKWTWCGRYSVPVALFAAYYLNNAFPLEGELIDYSTSITRLHIPVDDLQMGHTAIATKCHWVGYAAVGYR